MTTIHVSENASSDGMRPINLQTDLASLADLIELVFADSMDGNGRAALREMRYLSRIGPGLRVLSRMNEMAAGVSLGYVWIAEGELVGNVSVYAANWPASLGSAWIIANVGVHPDYQRRGIARQLMWTSLDMIRRRGATTAILQVDADNHTARRLYRSLGFVAERSWTTWRRRSSSRVPTSADSDLYIRHRRRSEWQDEMALTAHIRPQERGGIGWLRPLHPNQFRKPFFKRMGDWLNLRSTERLVARPPDYDQEHMLASLWIENTLASKTRLTLLVEPDLRGHYDDALLNNAIRRYGRNPLLVEHPTDDTATNSVLERYHFVRQREVIHMRWDAP